MEIPPPAPLHPDTAKYLENMVATMEKMKLPPLWQVPVPRRRALNKMLIKSGNPPMAECDLVEDVTVPTRAGSCPGRVFRGVPADGSVDLPTIVYIHGGGFAIGGLDESEHECRGMAAGVPGVVFAIEYRKTPETPYPGPDEDCYDLFLYAVENAKKYGANPDRVIVTGTSCGGCVATAIARMALERGGPKIDLVVPITPWYDKTMSLPSYQTYATGVHLDFEEVEHYRDMYLPNGAADADAYNSPALFDAIEGMPPHYIIVAECDGVMDDAYLFAEKLKAVGTPVDLVLGKGLIHAFTLMFHLIPHAATFLEPMYTRMRQV